MEFAIHPSLDTTFSGPQICSGYRDRGTLASDMSYAPVHPNPTSIGISAFACYMFMTFMSQCRRPRCLSHLCLLFCGDRVWPISSILITKSDGGKREKTFPSTFFPNLWNFHFSYDARWGNGQTLIFSSFFWHRCRPLCGLVVASVATHTWKEQRKTDPSIRFHFRSARARARSVHKVEP